MNIKNIEYEKVGGVYSGILYDLDRYIVTTKTPLSTQEYTVTVDHINRNLRGDCVRYGEQGDLDQLQILELLQIVESSGKIAREYKQYL